MRKIFVLILSVLFAFVLNAQEHGAHCYDSSKVHQGLNVFSVGDNGTVLTDMQGQVLQKYRVGLINVLPDGNMVGLADTVLMKFDSDMNIEWVVPVWGHHDIAVAENGRIYILSGHVHEFMGKGVKFEAVVGYSPEGKQDFVWCLYDHIHDFFRLTSKSPWFSNLPVSYEKSQSLEGYISQDPERFFIPTGDTSSYCAYEISHFNSLCMVPDNHPYFKQNTTFKKGSLLVSFMPYAAYGILNTETGNLEWAGFLQERSTLHSVSFTPNGNILAFENATDERMWGTKPENEAWLKYLPRQVGPISKQKPKPWLSISEYDPATGKKVWEYIPKTVEGKDILAKFSGSAQRLPNGNTLICMTSDTEGGRTLEVTSQKQIVWEYLSPEKDGETLLPFSYYRAKRISFDVAKKMIVGFGQ